MFFHILLRKKTSIQYAQHLLNVTYSVVRNKTSGLMISKQNHTLFTYILRLELSLKQVIHTEIITSRENRRKKIFMKCYPQKNGALRFAQS